MLALLLMLATVLAPWGSVLAMPSDHENAMQHQSAAMDSSHESMDHSDMSMGAGDCCETEECADCDQDCGACPVMPALTVNQNTIQHVSLSQLNNGSLGQLDSNIPPPPNKPPV